MSVVYCEGVGWASLLAFWTNDIGEDGVDISVSGGGGAGDLTVVAAEMIHNGLGVGITQRHVIGGANAIQGVSADPAVFGMAIVNGTMGHTADPVDFTQNHTLITVNADQGHTATIAVQGVVLQSVPATMGHVADTVTDIEEQISSTPITPVAAEMIHNGLGVGITQLHVLVPVNATLGNVAGG
jgi:hypothetical protein